MKPLMSNNISLHLNPLSTFIKTPRLAFHSLVRVRCTFYARFHFHFHSDVLLGIAARCVCVTSFKGPRSNGLITTEYCETSSINYRCKFGLHANSAGMKLVWWFVLIIIVILIRFYNIWCIQWSRIIKYHACQ